jgi:Tol biopolymer transport system component
MTGSGSRNGKRLSLCIKGRKWAHRRERPALTRFGGVDEVNPKWMPDGQLLVFEQLRERSPRSDIASITPDGPDLRVILSTKAWMGPTSSG